MGQNELITPAEKRGSADGTSYDISRGPNIKLPFLAAGCGLLALLTGFTTLARLPLDASDVLARCSALHVPAGPHPNFPQRTVSDRFVAGTKATLIRNATIWTGHNTGNQVIVGDVLLDGGMIRAVGTVPKELLGGIEVNELDARMQWLTPGLCRPLAY